MSRHQALRKSVREDSSINSPPSVELRQLALPEKRNRIYLWDLPLRVFHWSLLAAVSTAIVTGKIGGAWMGVHAKAGLTIVGLLAFRLVWGVVGTHSARFASFWPTPRKLLAYVRGKWQGVGHNPLGALSVLALLGVLGLQASSGLFSSDDIAFNGPLSTLVDDGLVSKLTSWHHVLATVIYVLIALHLAAILFYVRVKKNNLVKPMVTGWKDVAPTVQVQQRPASALAFFFALAIALAAAWGASGRWANASAQAAPTAAAKPAAQAPAW